MRTLTTLEVIAHPKTLLLRCKLRVQLSKNPSPRSLDPKIQSRPMKKPLLRPTPMNQGRSPIKIRKRSILKRSETRKTLFWLQKTTPLRVKRSGIIKATEGTIIVKRRAILLGIARNFEKTSVGLANLHAGNW